MIEDIILFLQANMLAFGPLGVFLASVIEEVIAPIPSALIMTMSGFIFVSGPVSSGTIYSLIFKVAIPAALGVTLGSFFVYFLSRYGGRFVIDKFGKYVGLYWSDIEKMQGKLSGTKKDEIIILGARILPIVPSVAISAFCGVMEMGILKYFVLSFIGTFIRGIMLGILGWQVGGIYIKYAHVLDQFGDYVLYTIVLAVFIFIVIKWKGES